MNILDENNSEANSKISQKAQTLIIGRLLVTFLLLLATWFWYGGQLALSLENVPSGLISFFIVSVGITIFYFFLLKFNKSIDAQLRFQLFVDVVLITWLVWRTGDVSSPYVTLYTLLICVTSIYLGLRGTLIVTIACVAAFTFLSISAVTSIIQSFALPMETSKAVQLVGFHGIAMLVVGLLSAKLAERRGSVEKLTEATKTLADLRALHERIVESIRSGVVTTDLQGNIYTFNAAAEEITGYRADEVRGWTIFELMGDIKQPIAVSLEASDINQTTPRFEIDFVTPENFALRLGYGISPLFTESGEKQGLILTFQDLTEIRSMEESVRRKDRLAAVGRVAAGLAHEIRNPLGAMRGAIQVLQSQAGQSSTQASLMDIVLRESDRLNSIITNFLSYASPRMNNFTELDLGEAINDSYILLQHSPDVTEKHSMEIDLPATSVIISADSTQIKQVFWNLTRNAIQAMPDGGKLIVKLVKLLNGRVQILFTDSGNGMSPQQVEKLFEPFSNSTTGGTGLGLSIVYQIIRDHGGTINVRSREGSGTTITVELPSDAKPQNFDEPANLAETVFEPSRLESFLTIKSAESEISLDMNDDFQSK
jgi:two-component system, NtrC family, sensor histidine kinase PilS